MFRCFCTFLLICLLAACVRQPVRHRQSYETFVGINEAELVYTIGPPDNIYEIGKERFLTYYKNGSTYLDMVLADKSGEISAKLWDFKVGVHEAIEANTIVKVRGVMQEYNRQPQFRVERIRTVSDSDEVDFNDFVPSSGYSSDFLMELEELPKNPERLYCAGHRPRRENQPGTAAGEPGAFVCLSVAAAGCGAVAAEERLSGFQRHR